MCGGLMMPVEERYNIELVKDKFSVFEIPTLIIIDRYGNLVSRDGLSDIKKYSKTQLMSKWTEGGKKD
jgi:3D (Asp-Asp-Asp) domain-containing protein